MPIKPVLAFGRIFYRIEQRLIVIGPYNRTDLLGRFGKVFSSAQVADMQPVLAEAGIISGIGKQVAVFTYVITAQGHELFTLGKLIDIYCDLFCGFKTAFFSAMDLVLFARLPARIIKVAAIFEGHVYVGFFDVAHHLAIELLLKRISRLHDDVGIGILRFQILRDFRIRFFPQPFVVIHKGTTVDVVLGVDGLRHGRRRRVGWGRRRFVFGSE